MEERVGQLEAEGRVLEAARLRQRTTFDLEMMRELGFCSGIENYSRHLSRRDAGSRPWTLLDYFPPDWLLVVDESHMSIPQVVGMYKNDRTRKEILVDFGFRLPSALDNRPLTFEEFEATVHQAVYMSATPGPYELERSERVVEQLIRPTGIVDPRIEVRPTEGQIDDLLERIRGRAERGERAIVTTLTQRMAEQLADYLHELGVKVSYLHAEVDTLDRVQILRDLRLGVYDVVVGINLLREGIDLPEVTLVAILDADKEGFLRSAWSLVQMIGRAARNVGGEVVMYADTVTQSMRSRSRRRTGGAPGRRRYNREHGIEPVTIVEGDPRHQRPAPGGRGAERAVRRRRAAMTRWIVVRLDVRQVDKLVVQLEAQMKEAARNLEFERAAALRDQVQEIRLRVLEQDASVVVGRAAERAAAKAAERAARRPTERTGAPPADRRRGHVGAGAPGRRGAGGGLGEPRADGSPDAGTAADWLPGIRDAHEDEDDRPAGRRPGWSGPRGTRRSRRTSRAAPAGRPGGRRAAGSGGSRPHPREARAAWRAYSPARRPL